MSGQTTRVAVLADWWWPETVGGAERSARAAALAISRFAEVAVFVPAAVESVYADGPLTVHAVRRPFARRVHADSAVRRGIEFLTAWLLPAVAARLARRIREFGPDVVYATNVSRTGPWLVRRMKAGGPGFVRSYHDLSDTCWRRSRRKGADNCATICGECRAKTWMMRRATPGDAVSVCVSGFVRTELVSAGLTTDETSFVAYPLIGSGSGTEAPRGAGTASEAGAADGRDDVIIGYIGRLSPVKGIESAIRTAAAYRRGTASAVSMVIAGEGQADYLRELASLAAAEEIEVDFAGHLDVDVFCARADAVLIPSTWLEPFGRVAVEVGSRGRPMLISPLGGLPEAAAVSGGRFAFADFRDPEAAALALADLVANRSGAAEPEPGRAAGGGLGRDAATTAVPLERGVADAVRRALPGRRGARTEPRP